ncbi:LapA family protein [Paraferrimonas sp. SM1919]|uniref:LapA family protein n=1 Tax=Paraferrimonas sp. SM1919 TaxID=2662263 RepID=UPI0013D84D7C|nr:lipopolysaccharide assembly protein LapA domain-containing protein [Paraferrimonas sp. SM1919]
MKTIVISILVLSLFILALAFGSQNQQLIEINYFVATDEFNLSSLLALTFLGGFICSWVIAFLIVIRLKLKLKFVTNKLEKLHAAEISEQA